MSVRRCPDHDRHNGNLAISDAAFGDHRFGKFSYRGGVAAQHRDFETALMVEMNMQCRDLQFVMRVICPDQPLSQFSGMVGPSSTGCDLANGILSNSRLGLSH